MILIQPCLEDETLIRGEILLNSEKIIPNKRVIIKFKELCNVFKGYKRIFSNLKYSDKLGIATCIFSKKVIIITKFGRIVIQKAKNEQDLLDTFAKITELLIKNDLLLKPRENP